MKEIKNLAGQTGIYGLSSFLPRFLNYLLVPFYTRIFTQAEYGIVTEIYAYVTFLLIILTFGMETGYFRFSSDEKNRENVYSTTLFSLIFTSSVFIVLVTLFSHNIATLLEYEEHPEYVSWFAIIVGLDAFNAIPFAYLRKANKAFIFLTIKVGSVGINIIGNLLFLWLFPLLHDKGELGFLIMVYDEGIGVGYVFIANLVASVCTTLFLLPYILKVKRIFNWNVLKQMLVYSLPLLVAGLIGNINEALDRIILKHLLPENVDALAQLGVYGANIKVAVLMMLYIQMFRYAFEPFFFQHGKEADARKMYAEILRYFVLIGIVMLLGIVLFLDIFKFYIGDEFWEGIHVVPILLVANLFLGVYYNLSLWYKLKDLTKYGAYMALIGAAITISINMIFIPKYGYTASAWARLICYFTMMVVSFYVGRKYLRIQYPVKKLSMYFAGAIAIVLIWQRIHIENQVLYNMMRILILAAFILVVEVREQIIKNLLTNESKNH